MFGKLRIFKEIIALIQLANQIADEAPAGTPKYGFLLTNRSFLVPAITITINILIILNFGFLYPVLSVFQSLPAELLAERVVLISSVLSFLWSYIERARTSAKIVITKKQAIEAVAASVVSAKLDNKTDAKVDDVIGNDMLSAALRKALKK